MPAQRIVLLGGAGAMGRITVRDFLRTAPRGLELVVADREIAAARHLGVRAVRADVTDTRSLDRALAGATVVIASLPYRFNLPAMHGALRARAHYIDLGGLYHATKKQMQLHAAFRAAGRTAVLGMGSAPGIINLLCVHAAAGMQRVDEVHCMVGNVDRTRYRSLPPLGFGYSPDTLLDEFTLPSAVFRRGRAGFVPALDPGEAVSEAFPAPIGRVCLQTTLHSEVATLPRHFAARGVREVTFRQSFEPAFVDKVRLLVDLGLTGTAPLDGSDIVPRSVLHSLLRRMPPAEPSGRENRYEVLRAVVHGRRAGRRVTVKADCHAGPRAGWCTGPDIDTGAPPSIVAQMLATGELESAPGVFAPEDVIPLAPFFRHLARRGMRITRRRTRTARRPARG
jgi:saccharopine dehydrogenase-like NADP-dependent oxidoreductase